MARQVIEIITEMKDKASGKMKAFSKTIKETNTLTGRQTETFQQMSKKSKKLETQMVKTTRGLKTFRMELLSILFFGMFIQRIFTGMARGAVTAFTKIMESNDMLGTALQRLGVEWEFLKFTIGSAINTVLERLLPIILPILNKLDEWIQKNPTLTATVILLGAALGFLMFFLATLNLGIGGMIQVLGPLSFLFTGTGLAVLSIVVAIGLLIAIFPKARSAFTGFIKTVGQVFKQLFFLMGDLFGGNLEKAHERMRLIMLLITKAFFQFGNVIVQIMAGISEAIVGLLLTPLFLVAKAFDAISAKLGKRTNVAGFVANLILDATSAVNSVVGAAGSFINNAAIAALDKQITTVQGGLEGSPTAGSGGTTIGSVNLNISGVNSVGDINADKLVSEIAEEIKRQL